MRRARSLAAALALAPAIVGLCSCQLLKSQKDEGRSAGPTPTGVVAPNGDASAAASSASGSPSAGLTAAGTEFLAFQGTLAKGGKFRLALERHGAALSGEFTRDLTSSDVSLTGSMKDATHFSLTEVVTGGAKPSTVDGELHPNGTIDATWKEPKGKPVTLSGGALQPFDDKARTFTQAYTGALGAKIRIRMKLTKAADGALSGVYRYTRSKEDLKLAGKVGGDGAFDLDESTAKGQVTGRFKGVFLAKDAILARWFSPDDSKSFPVTLQGSEAYPEIVTLDGGAKIVPQEEFAEPTKNCTRSSIFPQITGLAPADAQASLNKALKGLVGEDGKAGAFTKSDCEGASAEMPFTVENEYAVTAKRGRFVALELTSYSFTGGAHGMHGFTCTVADLQKGTLVRLASLLTPDGKKKLEAMVNDALAKENAVRNLSEAGFDSDHVPLGNDPDLCVDDKGLEVRFHLYEIAPYMMGEPSAHFTNAEVRPLFTPGNDVTDALFK